MVRKERENKINNKNRLRNETSVESYSTFVVQIDGGPRDV